MGFALARVAIVVPSTGTVSRDIELARVALQMREVRVSADPVSRARGELGTATVVTREAIANLGASSIAGVLELLPGVPLQAPGLDAVQQISLRAVPTIAGDVEQLAAFGTLIVLDGVPMSNNANLQSTGPRGEFRPRTSAGGGIDLRRIPAAALERVEVIRGVPSARFGDLTQGTIVVDTRAGEYDAELLARYDPRTGEVNASGGRLLTFGQEGSLSTNLARTLVSPGLRNSDVWRGTADLAYRFTFGGDSVAEGRAQGSTIDSRLNVFQVYEHSPEQPDILPGNSSTNRSGGARLSQRARFGAASRRHLELTTSLQREWQNTEATSMLVRGAQPFTDRLTPGRSTGHFVGGAYRAGVQLDGAPWQLFSRWEGVLPTTLFGGINTARIGTELRREWNGGAGYTFDVEFPPQVSFNGVNGFDRPRRYDEVPPVATSAAYVDDRLVASLPGGIGLDLQAGLRADVLHSGTWWTSASRDLVLQPRINAQLAPRPWLRLRGGWGRTAKLPSLGQLYPAPQFYDVINVNWYPPDENERLAVLTTFVLDPTSPDLRFATGTKSEAGFEIDIGSSGAALGVTAFRDRIKGGVGFESEPTFLLREHFALTDSTTGTGAPPDYIVPAYATDTVPVFVQRPVNVHDIENRGIELTLSLPEIQAIQTRLELQGAWMRSHLANDLTSFGAENRVSDFQLDSLRTRAPYWSGYDERGERSLATARIVHHQSEIGLVVTGVIQYYIRESRSIGAATDTLAWEGYVTRAGTLVPVPLAQRTDAQYADLRQPRIDLLSVPASPPPDWMFNLQVAKTIFGEGRFSFYAFNALDRLGKPEASSRGSRLFPRIRFGLELSFPLRTLH